MDMDERGMEQTLPQPMPLATFDEFQRKHMREVGRCKLTLERDVSACMRRHLASALAPLTL